MNIENISTYVSEMQLLLDRLPLELIDELVTVLEEARLSGRQIFIMGNGGSASTASHFAADLAKNTRRAGLPNFRVISLADNMAIFSALANDEGYENVFVQQLASFVRPRDIVIGISASGNSKNVIHAIDFAHQVKALTVGMTGFDGGILGPMVDLHIHVPSNIIEQVEDVHLMIEHMVVKTMKLATDQIIAELPSESLVEYDSPLYAGESPTSGSNIERIRASLEVLKQVNFEQRVNGEINTLVEEVLSLTIERVGAESGSLLLLDEDGGLVEAALAYDGDITTHNAKQLAEIAEKGLAGWVVANRQPVLVAKTEEDPRWLPRDWEKTNGSSRSAMSVPLMNKERVMGVLTLVRSVEKGFTRDDLVLLTAIAVFVSAKSTNARSMQ